jgi:hypothetical protein
MVFTALALATVVACSNFAWAAPQETEGEVQEQPPVVIRLEIDETVDGKPAKWNITGYLLRKKLREAGLSVWSAEPIWKDKAERKQRAEAAKEAGVEPEPLLEDEKPTPTITIRGTSKLNYDRSSTFYGKDLASFYKATVALEIIDHLDGDKVAAALDEADEWGRKTRQQAQTECANRVGLFTAVAILRSRPIQNLLNDKAKVAVKAFCDKIEGKRKKKPVTPDGSTGSDGTGK